MIIIYGSSGQAREIEWTLSRNGKLDNHLGEVCFIARDEVGKSLHGIEVFSEDSLAKKVEDVEDVDVYLGLGMPNLRRKIFEELEVLKTFNYPNLIDQNVVYDSRTLKLGKGVWIAPGCLLTTDILIDDFVFVNTGVSIGHDAEIGSFSTISPGVKIAGNVVIGKQVFIGIGAIISDHICICDHVVIGAGAVVVEDIVESGTYVGVPARKINPSLRS